MDCSEALTYVLWVRTALPHIDVAVSLLVGIPTVTVWISQRKLRQRPRTTVGRHPDSAQREARRRLRRPTTQPSKNYGTCTPEMLARSMRCTGRVPIEQYRHWLWPVNFWRELKLIFLTERTAPKSAFTVTNWQLEPMASTDLANDHPYCGGFTLKLRLHHHENRSHLRRSLQAGRSAAGDRRLVVIASARDMLEPTSWVRCIVVGAYSLELSGDRRKSVVLRTADPSSVGGPTVYRCRRNDAPTDAIWLIAPTSDDLSPPAIWGERFGQPSEQQAVPIDSTPQDCDEIDNEAHLTRRMSTFRKVRVGFWLFLGPVIWAVAFVLIYMRVLSPQNSAVITGLSVYIAIYLYGLLAALLYIAIDSVKAWCWRNRDGQTRVTWKNGTGECLIMGGLLRNGPYLSTTKWKEHCA